MTTGRLDGAMMALLVWVCVLAMLSGGCAMFGGGKVDRALAQGSEQARRQAITDQLLMKLAERDNGVVADTLASMEPGGAVGWLRAKRAIRDELNKPLLDKAGNVQFEELEVIGKSRSGREFGNISKGTLTLAGLPRDKEGKVNLNALPDAMRVEVEALAGASTVNVEWAKVWGDATVAEKNAAAAAVEKSLNARKGLIVSVIDSGGNVVAGILQEVIKVSPYGAATAIASVIAKVDNIRIPANIVEPFTMTPAEAMEASAAVPPGK